MNSANLVSQSTQTLDVDMLDLDESDSDRRDALRTYLEKINFVLPNFKQKHERSFHGTGFRPRNFGCRLRKHKRPTHCADAYLSTFSQMERPSHAIFNSELVLVCSADVILFFALALALEKLWFLFSCCF